MKIRRVIWFVLLCLSLPTWAQTMDDDVLDINLLHSLRNRQSKANPADTILHDTLQIIHHPAKSDTLSLSAGDTIVVSVERQDTIIVIPTVPDSLDETAQNADDILLQLIARQSELLHANDTIWEKYPHPLCMPLMYVPARFVALTDTTTYNPYSIPAIREKARRYITTHHVDMYVSVSDTNRLKQTVLEHLEVQRAIVKDVQEDRLDIERALRYNDSPWKYEANLSLQITQNYATDNWYQGAVNAFAMLAGAKGKLTYTQDNLSWESVGEWRYGLSSISGDSLRLVNTTDDVFRINSKFGYLLHKKLYLSSVADFRTNLMPSWRKNTNELASTFMTPMRFTLGVGVDYKPIKGLDITVSPITYKMVYALNTDPARVNVTDYGIEQGENAVNELGSSLRVDWKWRPLREIIVEANFYFFTNYKRIETELEIDVDFIINRFLSAKVMLHPRYDSTVELDPNRKTKIQFKEFISIGFSHTFR
ncbi:MAG: DUF3078 domain-containing protein [Paludibacteraceae bacterium]|nr:DUF3078 domain-containing protein [Paludibacteraceae bacterium]